MNTVTNNEDAICDLLDDFARALYEKNAAGAIAPLADDAVAFDLAPPLKQDPDAMHDLDRLEEWLQPGKARSFPRRSSGPSRSTRMWLTPTDYSE
jgi:ketosteroid isomerase-like protein